MISYLDIEYIEVYNRWALFSLDAWGWFERYVHLPLDHTNARLAFQRGYTA